MGRTACTEPQCLLYKGDLYLFLLKCVFHIHARHNIFCIVNSPTLIARLANGGKRYCSQTREWSPPRMRKMRMCKISCYYPSSEHSHGELAHSTMLETTDHLVYSEQSMSSICVY